MKFIAITIEGRAILQKIGSEKKQRDKECPNTKRNIEKDEYCYRYIEREKNSVTNNYFTEKEREREKDRLRQSEREKEQQGKRKRNEEFTAFSTFQHF